MEITFIAHASFKLRGNKATVVTDPFDPAFLNLKFPKVEADIVTISHEHADHNYLPADILSPLLIQGPGEYESKGVNVIGVSSYHDDKNGGERGLNTIYRIEMDGISLVHLGDLGHKLNDTQLELLDGVDILMIPVGGFYTLSVSTAVEVVNQIEPLVIIPMHYLTQDLKGPEFAKLSGVDVFLKEMGKEHLEPQAKYNITKDKKPAEATIVVLTPSV
ncbi:hypothetical protein A3D03_06055 [Candidatus Gottesmanbacteria bacterium RIFCSPHIGHO2_02_FULL_40_13]|uniref:Lactamase n=1 Tax=Candidatus Gottesmanbacteria bacterium RIFCSPHIGHO2_02_FULL_40_13 TaxID=1798384 RepID=A0A1F6A6R2_9BACT|nr:MAG: hypothetical protein A3D03_06055 [Candidatus Gottesmanbacteria bacterium RIFCSPHIGHO2_02_FULL_40_13]